ncbi:hypothetical protein [Sandarakinorhabdus sp. DWP1-3-1]|uniref:hypothetical protein n=1 Tax=Sandarakinorhabdus sp. DWP1-3-1 TaxID=2804627 RepID=UPI003CF116CA
MKKIVIAAEDRRAGRAAFEALSRPALPDPWRRPSRRDRLAGGVAATIATATTAVIIWASLFPIAL